MCLWFMDILDDPLYLTLKALVYYLKYIRRPKSLEITNLGVLFLFNSHAFGRSY